MSCYAFFEGWLLLSLPPRCLRLTTPFSLTLSQHLGTLTSVWVVPLLVRELTPRNPFPEVVGADEFGVQKKSGSFRVLTFQLVLYPISRLARD